MATVCVSCLHLDHHCSHNCCFSLLFNRCKNIWQQFCQGSSHAILSFLTKLLRTIITASAFTFLEYPDQFMLTVWLFDGNIPYLSTAHIPLFLVALTTFLFLWLPFTLILLFMQCICKKTHHRALHCFVRLKPYIKSHVAYSGFGSFIQYACCTVHPSHS